jgi:hypothetical protein
MFGNQMSERRGGEGLLRISPSCWSCCAERVIRAKSNVRFWGKADIARAVVNVLTQSGHSRFTFAAVQLDPYTPFLDRKFLS